MVKRKHTSWDSQGRVTKEIVKTVAVGGSPAERPAVAVSPPSVTSNGQVAATTVGNEGNTTMKGSIASSVYCTPPCTKNKPFGSHHMLNRLYKMAMATPPASNATLMDVIARFEDPPDATTDNDNVWQATLGYTPELDVVLLNIKQEPIEKPLNEVIDITKSSNNDTSHKPGNAGKDIDLTLSSSGSVEDSDTDLDSKPAAVKLFDNLLNV